METTEIPKSYKHTEVGVIPSDWEVRKLGVLVEKFVNGGTPSTQIADYWKGEMPWITGADILNQKVAEIRRYITKEAIKNSSTNVIEKGNLLLVSRTGVGKLAIAPFDIAISQDFTGIYTKKEVLSPDYLFRYFDYAQSQLKSQNQGTSIQGITRETLSSIRIPLPPTKAEQTAIAAALHDADALISSLERLIAKKRSLKHGAMQELLQPQAGWDVKRLGEVVNLVREGVIPCSNPNIIFAHFSLPAFDETKKPSFEFGTTIMSNKFKVPQGAVLISKLNPRIPRVWMPEEIPDNSVASTEFLILMKKPCVTREYLYTYCSSPYFCNQMELAVTGTTGSHQRVNPNDAMLLYFSYPNNIEEQTRIARILADMDAEIEALEQKLAKYRLIKQGMMQQLLTGKIRLV